jgi:hypothetical protein
MELDDQAVIELASEDASNRQHRMDLRNTRRILEAGERICRKYMARRDLKLDPELRTGASRLSDSSTTRTQPGRPTTARRGQNRRDVSTQNLQPQAPSYAEPEPSYYEASPATPTFAGQTTLNRAPSRATIDSQRTATSANMSTADDPYAPSTYDRHRQDPTPSYGRYDPHGPANEGYVAPAPPPRPANQPPIPPKRPDDDVDQRRSGGGLRQVFGRKA